LKEIEPIVKGINLNVFCLEKRASQVINYDFRFDEIYSISDDKVKILSDDSEFDFESFKLQYIRNIKLDKLI
jgi:hypothetical protein